MEYGSMSIHRLQSGRWLNWGIRFFLTAALTASQTAGGYAPFALGCIAAAMLPDLTPWPLAAALLGGVTGALLFLDFQQVLALAAVGILILTAATAFRDTAFLQKPWVLPVLAASARIPDKALERRRTIGVRIPASPVARAVVGALGCPMITTSVKDDDQVVEYTTDPELIHERYGREVALVIDGGIGDNVPTTVVDLTGDGPEILREGKGELQ